MINNSFKIAIRSFRHNKVFSLINIIGLAIGISASLVIYLIVSYDFSFDKFENGGDRIYRIVSNSIFSGESFKTSGVPYPMAKAVQSEVSGLEEIVPFRTWDDGTKVSVREAKSSKVSVFKKENRIAFVDENYFNLLSYNWVAGSPKTSLQQPYYVVLTAFNAKRYFPDLSASEIIGKKLYFNDTILTTVSGIVKDLNQNTDFTFKTFISRASLETESLKPQGWEEWSMVTSSSQLLIKLAAGTTTANIQTQIATLAKKYSRQDPEDPNTTIYNLQPLSDIHFNSDYDNFNQRRAHKPTLYGLLWVAAFLLILGCINFINLTTAQSSQRAKEIGIRKTMGSSKGQLIFQFLNETFLLTVAATILSIGLTPLLFKIFADFIPAGLHYNLLQEPTGIILFLLLLVIGMTLLSGFYPAMVLSSFKPVAVLKNQAQPTTGKSRNARLRKTLTVSQFIISQVFIVATILVSKQISYSLNKDLGFKKNAIIYFDINYNDPNPGNKLVLMNKLKTIPEIAMVSLSSSIPSSNNTSSMAIKYNDGQKEIETQAQLKMADSNYIQLYQMKLLAGYNLPQSDTVNSLIINNTYAKILGFINPQEAIGKYLAMQNKKIPIVGVVQDFHQQSLHEQIKPLFIASNTSWAFTLNVALRPQNSEGTTWKSAITKIQSEFNKVYPQDDFEYQFFDESIAKYYTSEKNISRLLMWATGLAIFISCLGLLGLVIYITNQRTKEIGIRKVVGATIQQIVYLLSKDFLKLIIVAIVIAAPVAWYGVHKWLQDFSYRTNISWWVFILAGFASIFIAFLTISLQAIKAAIANPVKSLRAE